MMHLGRYIVLLRLVLSQHSTWTALVMGFRLSRPGLTYKQHIRGGFGRGGEIQGMMMSVCYVTVAMHQDVCLQPIWYSYWQCSAGWPP